MSIAETTPEARDELARLQGRLDLGYAGPGHIVREILPGGYPAYVRILHPFVNMSNGTDTRTWASMAAQIGLTLHGETYHGTLARADVTEGPRQWLAETGRLRLPVQNALASVLAEVSGTSDVYFGYILSAQLPGWDEPIVATAPLDGLEDLQRRLDDEADTQDGPEYWWPRDHAWVVCSDYDLTSTYVACSEDVAQAIVAHPDIEALYVTPEMRIDSASDRS
ncbi:hypothetical protein OG943_17285 [Amycolatopsis sp. NBC_00345]|uniref:hypothetical protein n=1 Tax=Amycolatopsis sp. NBC_00345 TaxID=2975955 RepID=UPI002E2773B9